MIMKLKIFLSAIVIVSMLLADRDSRVFAMTSGNYQAPESVAEEVSYNSPIYHLSSYATHRDRCNLYLSSGF